MALPITLDEIRPQVKAMFLPLDHDMKVKYTLVYINNQFKIAGIFTSSAHVSTFTLDLQQNVPRQFIYEDLHNVIKYMKHNFQDFIATSHKYTTPFHHYTHNTIFYYLNQINYRILETIAHIQQSYPQIVDQLITQPTTQPATQNLNTHSTFPQPATQPATQILDTHSTFPQPTTQPATQILDTHSTFPQPATQPATQNPDTHCPFPCCPRTPSPLAILQAYQPQSSQQQDQPNHIFSKPTGTPIRKKFKINHIPPHTQTM